MPAYHCLDAGVQQPVEHLIDLRARNAEYVSYSLCLQRFHNNVGSRERFPFHLCHGAAPLEFIYSVSARSDAGSRLRSVVRKLPWSGRRTSYSHSIWTPTRNCSAVKSST